MKIKSLVISGLGILSFASLAQAEVVSGCQEQDYITVSATQTSIETANGYTPKCLKVKAGTTVSIAASRMHPLQAQRDIGGVANPFASENPSISKQTHTLSQPGFYGYFCTNHGDESGRGMAGSIQVVQ